MRNKSQGNKRTLYLTLISIILLLNLWMIVINVNQNSNAPLNNSLNSKQNSMARKY